MKMRVSFKTPDAIQDAVAGMMVHAEPDLTYREGLREKLNAVANKYVSYGETITVEFDTDTGIATVVPKVAEDRTHAVLRLLNSLTPNERDKVFNQFCRGCHIAIERQDWAGKNYCPSCSPDPEE